MEKTDESIKNLCLAAIKRSTIPPFDFKYTKVNDDGELILPKELNEYIDLENDESIICLTIITDKIWTILSTKRIFSMEGIGLKTNNLKGIKKWDFGDFKGYSKQEYTKGFLYFDNDEIIPVFVQTGRASMVMIYGVMTISKLMN